MLASNRLAQDAVDAALADLVKVDERGNVRLKPGRTVADVQRLQQARQAHVKTIYMLTGTEGTEHAERRIEAQAGAAIVIMRIGAITGRPQQPIPSSIGTVVPPSPVAQSL